VPTDREDRILCGLNPRKSFSGETKDKKKGLLWSQDALGAKDLRKLNTKTRTARESFLFSRGQAKGNSFFLDQKGTSLEKNPSLGGKKKKKKGGTIPHLAVALDDSCCWEIFIPPKKEGRATSF